MSILSGIISASRVRGGGGTVYLLDETGLGSAAFALSASRLLRDAYTGPSMRVRRSSDNAEADVGFSSGSVSLSSPVSNLSGGSGSTLSDWSGSDSVFCKILYDQSGNGRDFEMTTTANQPRLVNGGTLEVQGTRACLYFDGSNDYLAINSSDASAVESIMNADTSAALVVNTLGGVGMVFGKRSGSNARCFAVLTGWSSTQWTYTLENVNVWTTGISDTGHKIIGFHRSGTSVSARANGSLSSSFTVSSGSSSGLTYEINSATSPEQMRFQELVIWPSALSATPIGTLESNQNSHYSVY